MGAIAGSLVEFAILNFIDIKAIFLLYLISGAIAVIILIFYVKEIAIKKLATSTSIFGNIQDILKKNKPFVILTVIT